MKALEMGSVDSTFQQQKLSRCIKINVLFVYFHCMLVGR